MTNQLDHPCIMRERISEIEKGFSRFFNSIENIAKENQSILTQIAAMQLCINNEIFGHSEKPGLKTDVTMLKGAEGRREKLAGLVWASFLTSIGSLILNLITRHTKP